MIQEELFWAMYVLSSVTGQDTQGSRKATQDTSLALREHTTCGKMRRAHTERQEVKQLSVNHCSADDCWEMKRVDLWILLSAVAGEGFQRR